MRTIVFASQNQHKIAEISSKVKNFRVAGLDPTIFPDELLESGSTLDHNAFQKLRQVYALIQSDCFADDTGLEIEALNGEPGVLSARYAGNEKDSIRNMDLVLDKMKGATNRKARFRTVIALNFNGEEHLFEGICSGKIAKVKSGSKGFGYDPIFIPDGYKTTFAEMSLDQKNEISHRALAVRQLVQFINSQY